MNKNHIKKNARLFLELVPQTMWGKTVQAIVSIETWNVLKLGFGATNRYIPPYSFPKLEEKCLKSCRNEQLKCGICNAVEDELELHEQWQYDDNQLTQTLTDLIPVCKNCYLTIHFGRAIKLDFADKSKKHLALVNQWTQEQTDKHIHESFEKWQCRSQNHYRLDVNWLTQWLSESRIHLQWLNAPKRYWSEHKRWDAIAYAREFLISNAIIIDTETTGLLDYENVEVIELAIINMQGEIIYNSRFRPRYKIPKITTDIHGITDEDVVDSPTFKDEYPKILEAMNSKITIAYNAKFDAGVIEKTCKLYELEAPECHWECAMLLYQLFLGAGKWTKLKNATHNALNDCNAVLDLIKHMANDLNTEKKQTPKVQKPSEVTDSFWLYARREKGTYPTGSKNSGKWLIFVPLQLLDDVWEKIKLATEQGLLGNVSKTATARPNYNAANINEKVICVYTYDWTDEKDVKRIRKKLRELCITHKIPYKSDQDTFSDNYSNNGNKKISKYYE